MKLSFFIPIFLLITSCSNVNEKSIEYYFKQKGDSLNIKSYQFIKSNSTQFELDKYYASKNTFISDIELACNAYIKALNTNKIPLDIFFEYLLPPIIYNEPIEDWRAQCSGELAYLLNKPFQEICDTLNYQIKDGYKFGEDNFSYLTIGWNALKNSKVGDCFHIAKLLVYQYRSLGIPASIDFIHGWGNSTGSHCWGVGYINGKMRPLMETQDNVTIYSPFILFENRQDIKKSIYRYPAKVFRKTFSINEELLKLKEGLRPEDTPPILEDCKITDVSTEYFSTVTIEIPNITPNKLIYLSTYSNKWKIAVVPCYLKKEFVTFKNIKSNILYMPTHYTKHKNIPCGNPFIVNSNGCCKELVPNKKVLEDIIIHYLYPLSIEYTYGLQHRTELPDNFISDLFNNKSRRRPINGNKYILCSWIQGKWRAISQYIATNNTLHFHNIPTNSLLILQDELGTTTGRCFTYEKGKLSWW